MARLPQVGDDLNQWGSVLNEFLGVSMNPDGTLKSPGFPNPMAAVGDIITGGASGIAQRLGIGANGMFLGVLGGQPAWLPVPSGFGNPMTAAGDLITATAGGSPIRLAVGTGSQVLGLSGGLPAWVSNPAGFANPMTSVGDLITGTTGGNAQRLAIGTANQVLTSVAGAPAWANNPAGFTNPMSAIGDIITGGTAGAAQRLGVGANGSFLGVAAGIPTWLPVPSSPFEVIVSSGDATGTTDDLNFNNAVAALPNGGAIFMIEGNGNPFYTKAGWVLPAQTTAGNFGGGPISLHGVGIARLFVVGNNKTGIFYHRTSGYGSQFNPGANGAQPHTGVIHDVWISGLNATGASIGLDVGDGWGYDIRVYVTDFDTVGAIGCRVGNHIFWTEKNCRFVIGSSNNSTGVYFYTDQSDVSNEYNWFDISIFCNQNQNGIVFDNVNHGGSTFFIKGNMCQTTATSGLPANNTALITFKNGSATSARIFDGQLFVKVEFNQTPQYPTGSVPPWLIFMDGNGGGIRNVSGQLTTSLNGIQTNGEEFSFTGLIDNGDVPPVNGGNGATASSLWPTTPGTTGTTWTNKGPDTIVSITGGSVSSLVLNGFAINPASPLVPVGAGGTLAITATGPPTVQLVLARVTFR